MTLKVTNQMTFRLMQSEINTISNRLQDLRQEAATGKRFNQPSDDPSAVRPVLNYSKQIRANERFQENMGMAHNKLQAQDSHLDHAENTLTKAKQHTIQAISGALNQNDREILADQIGQMKNELLDTANAQLNERYLFAGYEEETQPFQKDASAPGGVEYRGDNNARKVEIAPGEKLEVGIPGDELFGFSASQNVFETLNDIETEIRNGNSESLNDRLGELDKHMTRLRKYRGEMGITMNRVETSIDAKAKAENDLKQILGKYENADIAETSSQIVQRETALRAALNVTSRMAKISILDYM